MEKKNTGTIAFRFRQVLLYYIRRSAPTFVLLKLRLRIICPTDFNKNTFVWGSYAILHPPYSPDLAPSDFHLFGP